MSENAINHDAVLDFDIAGLPHILQKKYIGNHQKELKVMMQLASKKKIMDEIGEIKRSLKHPIAVIQKYAKTKHAAAYIDVDPSFLDKKRREGLFKFGVHYHRPAGCSLVMWDIEALEKWVTDVEVDNDDNKLIDNMFT